MGCVNQKTDIPKFNKKHNQQKIKTILISQPPQNQCISQGTNSIIQHDQLQQISAINTNNIQTNTIITEGERKKQIMEMYKIDKDQKLPNVPKINVCHYEALLIHNPQHLIQTEM